MANKRLDMRNILQLLRLYTQGVSKLQISRQLGLSRNTVKKYIESFHQNSFTYQELSCLSNEDLEELFDGQIKPVPEKNIVLESLFPTIEKELKRVGVTRQLLWEEYRENHPDGYSYSQFCYHYQNWRGKLKPSMHMHHKAGDKVFVDYTGKKLSVIDQSTGELYEVEVFVSVLGASGLTFVEATRTQNKEDFMGSLVKMLDYYQGVPSAIVTDNLRTAVKKSDKYEPLVTEYLLDFASHYGTTILPTRAYHPKDKALVENAVRIIYTRIFAPLRKEDFFTIEALNDSILPLLEKHNTMSFKGRKYSRLDLFNEIEKETLSFLPVNPYQLKGFAKATVHKSSHVYLNKDKHYYSVPFIYMGKKVLIIYSKTTVEIYHGQRIIASHQRDYSKYLYTTNKEHMPTSHQFVAEWNPERFIQWGASVGEFCKSFIIQILDKKQHPEQSYKSCTGVLSLANKVGNDRLNNACKRAMDYEKINYPIIKSILEKGLDLIDEDPTIEDKEIPKHNNIRGREYYK